MDYSSDIVLCPGWDHSHGQQLRALSVCGCKKCIFNGYGQTAISYKGWSCRLCIMWISAVQDSGRCRCVAWRTCCEVWNANSRPFRLWLGGACQTQQQLIPRAHDRVNMKPAACTMNSHHKNDRQCFAGAATRRGDLICANAPKDSSNTSRSRASSLGPAHL
jgi:hypothetical protein